MRIVFTLLGCFLFFIGTAQKHYDIGFKYGPTFSTRYITSKQRLPDKLETKFLVSTARYISYDHDLSKSFSFFFDVGSLESGYTEAITLYDDYGNSKTFDVKRSFDYYSFASGIKLRRPLGNYSYYFLLGPRLDLFFDQISSPDIKWNYEHLYQRVFGTNLGIGLQRRFDVYSFFIEFQYQQDLSPAFNKYELESYNTTQYHINFLLFFGIKYDIGTHFNSNSK